MKNLKPNFTQIPNEFLDFDLADLSGGEFKILMFICRRTYGFRKEKDKISISQFVNGIGSFEGKVLNKGCGLSKPQVIKILKSLEEKGYIITKKTENKTTIFSLNFEKGGKESLPVKKDKVVKKVYQSGKESLPKVVKKVNTQKKHKINLPKETICSFLKNFENVFEKIWIEYGFKTNKKKAKDKLLVILKNSKNPEEKFKEILEGVKKYNSNREKLEKLKKWVPQKQQFVFWLNQERWQDEYDDVKIGPKYLQIKKGEYGEDGEAIEI